jgi:phosphoglycolate phosphatase
MPKRAVIFDLDGTLVDTAPDLLRATNRVLAENGRPALHIDQVRAFVGHGARSLITRGFLATGAPVPEGTLETLYRRFVVHYSADIARDSRLFPGAYALLARCREEGFALGVCTNKLEGLSRQLLEALGVGDFFGAVIGPDTLGIAKPDPAPYREALRRLGDAEMPSVLIGDSETDVLTARAAGVPVIGVTFGYTPVPVAAFGPDRLAEHYDAVWPMIDDLLAG